MVVSSAIDNTPVSHAAFSNTQHSAETVQHLLPILLTLHIPTVLPQNVPQSDPNPVGSTYNMYIGYTRPQGCKKASGQDTVRGALSSSRCGSESTSCPRAGDHTAIQI
jgi:hypothetical protein